MSAAKCRYTSGSWNAGRAAGCDAGAERCAGQSGEGGRDHAHEVRRGQQDRRSLRCAARCRRHDAGERYGTAPNGRAAAGHLAESRSLSASVGRSCSFRIGPGRSIRRPQHGGLRLSAVLMSILDRPKKKSAQMLRAIIHYSPAIGLMTMPFPLGSLLCRKARTSRIAAVMIQLDRKARAPRPWTR
jgi:hypothetical protein